MLVHAIMPTSRVNGPGLRCVVFVQGCNLACPGCWNVQSHDFHGTDLAIAAVVGEVTNCHGQYSLDGVTFSGGEPMQQADELAPLLHEAWRRPGPAASVLALDPRSTRFRGDGQIQPPSTV